MQDVPRPGNQPGVHHAAAHLLVRTGQPPTHNDHVKWLYVSTLHRCPRWVSSCTLRHRLGHCPQLLGINLPVGEKLNAPVLKVDLPYQVPAVQATAPNVLAKPGVVHGSSAGSRSAVALTAGHGSLVMSNDCISPEIACTSTEMFPNSR